MIRAKTNAAFSQNTHDFIEWYESGGKTKPAFMKRASNKAAKPKPLKLKINIKNKMKKCDNCQGPLWLDLSQEHCSDCIQGLTDPYSILQKFFDDYKMLPLTEAHNMLRKQTRLSYNEIDQFFFKVMDMESMDLIFQSRSP